MSILRKGRSVPISGLAVATLNCHKVSDKRLTRQPGYEISACLCDWLAAVFVAISMNPGLISDRCHRANTLMGMCKSTQWISFTIWQNSHRTTSFLWGRKNHIRLRNSHTQLPWNMSADRRLAYPDMKHRPFFCLSFRFLWLPYRERFIKDFAHAAR